MDVRSNYLRLALPQVVVSIAGVVPTPGQALAETLQIGMLSSIVPDPEEAPRAPETAHVA